MAHYDKPHLTVTHDTDLDAVVMDWDGFVKGQEYRDSLEAGLELVQQERATNWLADLREMGTVDTDDQEWTNQDWFPRAMDSTLKHMAIIKPEDVVADMSVDKIMQEVGDGDFRSHYFDNRDEAEEWLQEQTVTI
jgi:hypothetical protein